MDLGLAGTVAIVGGSSSGMGRATARTLAGEGCRVVLFARRAELLNSIAPGSIATDRLVQLYANEPDPEAAQRRDEAMIPAGRFGDPDEIAAAVAFLCSTGAAYITGTTLLVDGGLAQGLLS
ncbi:MAG: SDR family oxidoreductase [Gaiellales bacterium]